jgi:hypothetical protein
MWGGSIRFGTSDGDDFEKRSGEFSVQEDVALNMHSCVNSIRLSDLFTGESVGSDPSDGRSVGDHEPFRSSNSAPTEGGV